MLNILDFGAADDTLEEGRVALDRLEQQLRLRASNHTPDAQSETSSKLQSSVSRKKLDQLPRVARLNNRDESLGLTVEELDDRGLLDGGGSLPSYYSSMKQKNRRTLELQSRSARLQERGKEVVSKILNAVFHMLRTYQRWGMNVEEKFTLADPKAAGSIPKKTFLSVLKRIEMPLRQKELNDVANHYLDPATGKVDYQTMLKNGNISSAAFSHSSQINSVTSPSHSGRANIESGKNVLREVKRMLLEAIKALNKNFDDLYRMFARWDTDGSGTVTATQFLRVLNRLRVDISDADQDFLVELLDTQGMGRIDFESLLTYCLMSNNPDADASSTSSQHDLLPTYGKSGGDGAGAGADNDDAGAETVSAMSVDGNTSVDLKSNITPLGMKRPSTASNGRLQPPKSPSGLFDSFDFSNSNVFGANSSGGGLPTNVQRQKVRPMTALARVSTNQFSAQASPDKKKVPRSRDAEDLELMNLPDDVIHGEEKYLGENSNNDRNGQHSRNGLSGPFLETKEKPYVSIGIPSDQYDIMAPPTNVSGLSSTGMQGPFASDGTNYGSDPAPTPSHMDHLILLANQILGTLRDIILVRYRRGRSLYEIYQHFDRSGRGYFDLHDFVRATADLRIETSERVAKLAIEIMAIDSKVFVTFGEFKVYALDPEHGSLIAEVQNQLGQLYERYGKGFENFLLNEIQRESLVDDEGESAEMRSDIVARDSFARLLKKIGLQLPTADLARLLDRFDIYGNDECYVDRFLTMLMQSDAWRQATRNLEYQLRAQQEANYVRSRGGLLEGSDIPLAKEVIDMCEYLGIGMLSEENMIWIAVDALRAPLPVNWTVQRDHEGRNYFYNVLTNQSRWEHPLDPHFRNLRDRYRQSGAEYVENSPHRPYVASGSGIHAIRDKRSADKISPVANDITQWNTLPSAVEQQPPSPIDRYTTDSANVPGKMLKSVSATSAIQLAHSQHPDQLYQEAERQTAVANDSDKADRPVPIGVGKSGAALNPTYTYTGPQTSTPAIPKPVAASSSTMRVSSSGSRPISAPMLYRPWQESVKVNQRAKVSNFMQEREAMVEAIYTAPYAGKKFLETGGATNAKQSKAAAKAEKEDRMSKLQEMFQEDIVERLGQVLR